MPRVTCEDCGNDVLLVGIGGICPHCGQLLVVKDKLKELQQAEFADPPPSKAEPIYAAVVEPLSHEHVVPEEKPAEAEPEPQEPEEVEEPSRVLLYSIVGALSGIFAIALGTVIILAHARSKTAPPVVVAPAAVKPQKPPEPVEPIKPPELSPIQPPRMVAPGARPAPPLPHAAFAEIRPRPQALPKTISDDQIGDAITRGVAFLKSQFDDKQLKAGDPAGDDLLAGLDALAVYALLHCGQAIDDPALTPQNDQIKSLMNRLKEFPMNGGKATYSRSLRISALTVYNRIEDRPTITADLRWLLTSSMQGAFSYSQPPPKRTHDENTWDNSNSQYGALGVWAAADAGLIVPGSFWRDVERHWISAQAPSGGWGYSPGAKSATLSMTAAGTALLFVARDRAPRYGQSTATSPLTAAMHKATDWLDQGNNIIKIDGHRGYTVYGLERAGLASGYKYFGTHDWYRELGATLIAEQQPNGSWSGTDGPLAETSFALLFLARGRQPTFLTKLMFDGAWNNRPRDVSGFSRFAAYELERPLNWQVGDVQRNWWEYADAPVLLITSNSAPTLKESDYDKLRNYAQAGGLIFLNTEENSDEFNQFAADLAKKLFPDYPFAELPDTHPIYSTMYPLKNKPPLKAVSNGVRLLLLHSPTDLTAAWLPRPGANQRPAAEMSMNIIVYATGRQDFRNRLVSLIVPAPVDPPNATVPIARLKYDGNWDPEPMAWTRASRLLQAATGVAIQTIPTPISELKYESAPIAYLTGTGEVSFLEFDLDVIRQFVKQGGILLIDSCGSSQAFADSIEKNLLPKLFPAARIEAVANDDPLLNRTRIGMKDIHLISLRVGTPQSAGILQTVRAGSGQVIFSPIDLTSGLAGSRTIGIRGYSPAWCQDLVQNTVFATVARISDLVASNSRSSN